MDGLELEIGVTNFKSIFWAKNEKCLKMHCINLVSNIEIHTIVKAH